MTPVTGIRSSRVAKKNCSRIGRATGRGYSRTRLTCRVQERIPCPGLSKSPSTQEAAVTPATWLAFRAGVVAAVGQPVVQTQLEPDPDDAGFGQMLQGRPDPRRPALDALACAQARKVLERRDELRAAIRIARVVERIHADDDPLGGQGLSPGKRQSKKHGVASRNVRGGNLGIWGLGDVGIWRFKGTV